MSQLFFEFIFVVLVNYFPVFLFVVFFFLLVLVHVSICRAFL